MEYFIAILMIWVLIFMWIFFKKIIFRKVIPIDNQYTFKLSSRLVISVALTHFCIMLFFFLKVLTNFHLLFAVTFLISFLIVAKILYVLAIIENKIILSEYSISFIKHNKRMSHNHVASYIPLDDVHQVCVHHNHIHGRTIYFCLKNGNVKKFNLDEYNAKYYCHQIVKTLHHFGLKHEKIDSAKAVELKRNAFS